MSRVRHAISSIGAGLACFLAIQPAAAQNLMGVIQRWKDRGQGPDKVSDSTDGGEAADGRIARLYAQYQ